MTETTITDRSDLRRRTDAISAWTEGDEATLETEKPTNPHTDNPALWQAWERGYQGLYMPGVVDMEEPLPLPVWRVPVSHQRDDRNTKQLFVVDLLRESGARAWPPGGSRHAKPEPITALWGCSDCPNKAACAVNGCGKPSTASTAVA